MTEKTVEQEMKIFQDSMDLEEAMDICLAAQKKFLLVVAHEERQGRPEAALVKFCEESIASLDKLRRDVRKDDKRTIAMLMDRSNPMFKIK